MLITLLQPWHLNGANRVRESDDVWAGEKEQAEIGRLAHYTSRAVSYNTCNVW